MNNIKVLYRVKWLKTGLYLSVGPMNWMPESGGWTFKGIQGVILEIKKKENEIYCGVSVGDLVLEKTTEEGITYLGLDFQPIGVITV